MRSDIAPCRRPENRVYDRMYENIRIRMTFKLRAIRYRNAPELLKRRRYRTAFLEAVRIISESDSHAKYIGPPSVTAVLVFPVYPILMCIPFGGGTLPDCAAGADPTVIEGFAADCDPPFFARGGPIRQLWTRPSVRGACSTKHSS